MRAHVDAVALQGLAQPAQALHRGFADPLREALQRHGIDVRTHPLQSWDGGGVNGA